MPVGMNEDLGLKYPRQVRLVDEIKVRSYKMLICKNPKNKNVIRRGVRLIKKSKFINYKKRNKKLSV